MARGALGGKASGERKGERNPEWRVEQVQRRTKYRRVQGKEQSGTRMLKRIRWSGQIPEPEYAVNAIIRPDLDLLVPAQQPKQGGVERIINVY